MENQMVKLPELGLNSGPQALSQGHNHYTIQPHTYIHTYMCKTVVVIAVSEFSCFSESCMNRGSIVKRERERVEKPGHCTSSWQTTNSEQQQ